MHADSPPLWDRIESLKPNGRVPWRPSAPTTQVALCVGGPSPALIVADQFDPVITAVRSAWPIARSAVSPLASSGYGEHPSHARAGEGSYPPTYGTVTRTSPRGAWAQIAIVENSVRAGISRRRGTSPPSADDSPSPRRAALNSGHHAPPSVHGGLHVVHLHPLLGGDIALGRSLPLRRGRCRGGRRRSRARACSPRRTAR